MLLHFMIMCLFTIIIAMGTTTFQAGSNYSSSMRNIAKKPECQTKCGNVTVPYPFGIGEDCSLNSAFYLSCDESSDSDNTPQLFINVGGTIREHTIGGPSYYYERKPRIQSISDSELRIFNSASVTCYQEDGNISFENNSRTALYAYNNNPLFTLSEKNKFTVIGCYDRGLITHQGYSSFTSGCTGFCNNETGMPTEGQCSGKGCCQTSITKSLYYYEVTIKSEESPKYLWESNRCSYAFVGEEGSFEFHGIRDLFNNASEVVERIDSTVPVVYDWVINAPNGSCAEATECKENSHCYDVEGGGYRCRCNKGYQGNPYLEQGCQDIDECHDPETYPCYGNCNNTRGSYECKCPPGSFGDAKRYKCQKVAAKRSTSFTIIFILGALLGTGILVASIGMYKVVQRKEDKKRRDKFFKRNGGLLLQQQTLNGEDAIERTRTFSARELEKATDQYNMNRILGQGGQGTVYKGMLPDGKIVAVKKSVSVDETQVETFINEVFLLSQISHRNVVKLLGCCLETEVPVLVYEFVSNGNLFQFIHDVNYEFPTFWSIRITIATEVAGALAYMHTATSVPIYHRDIKSSNVLLDEKFRAKLSDFGISKSVMGDQTHLSTLVKGTYGYMDPEYFQSSQFTEKSDVYSFGIVLVELLTGKMPIYSIGPGESRSLATLILLMEEGLILENIDDRVSDGPKEQLIAVAKLAKRCLNLNGKLRPTMKEVATKLEEIRSASP